MVNDRTAIVVVIGGGALDPRAVAAAPAGAPVVAADSGLDVALAAGLVPTLVVGDLDSVSPAGLEWAEAHGVPVERHPTDKAATDTELALRRAAAEGADRLLVLSAVGDRFDHAVGAIAALGAPELRSFEAVDAWFGDVAMHVLHPGRRTRVAGPPGTVFSLMALHGTCTGVDVDHARWPLRDATLLPASTLGISNEVVDRPVDIGIATGVVTVIVPPTPPEACP